MKANNLENKIPYGIKLIQINQYNKYKQSLEIGDVDDKIPDISGLVTTTVLNTNIGEVVNKIPGTSCLVTPAVLIAKIGDVEAKIPDVSGLVKKTSYSTKIFNIETKNFYYF